MILADKIIRLRKKNGWSQEELAEKMNVSRQAVSKWEGAQTIPDLEKILKLGELFGVTTDYLLKDEIENEEYTDGVSDPGIRKITLAEANEYLELRKIAAKRIAIATMLCIVAVIPLLLLSVASEYPSFGWSEELACGVGFFVGYTPPNDGLKFVNRRLPSALHRYYSIKMRLFLPTAKAPHFCDAFTALLRGFLR